MATPTPRIESFTLPDGYRSAVRVWDAADPAAHIVMLHGVTSHSGWYSRTSGLLADAGCAIHFLDRRGSGLNLAERGDVAGWEAWLADVASYLAQLPTDRPRVVVGISWGGKLAAAIARRNPELIDGLGMICPGLFARQMPSSFARLSVRAACGLGMKRRRVTIPLRDPALFTDSAEEQDYIASDPLALREVTLRFAAQDAHLTRYATRAPEQVRSPVFCALAGSDRIVDNQRCKQFFSRLGGTQRTLCEYPDAPHTLEFSPAADLLVADIVNWLGELEQCVVARSTAT